MPLFGISCALASLIAAAAGEDVMGAIASEMGFKGAVTVLSEERDDAYQVITVALPYIDAFGEEQTGRARCVARRADLEAGKPLPAVVHVHYEKPVDDAKAWCDLGALVFTSHYGEPGSGYEADLSTGSANNQQRALLQWARRLPLVDRAHVYVNGGSQGGYMTLAMGAEFFPLCAIQADVPVLNWAYTVSYFLRNQEQSGYPLEEGEMGALPVMAAVTGIAAWHFDYFSEDLADEAYYRVSPISYLNRIGCPVLLYTVTGDMLVPMEQMTRREDVLHPFDPDKFPEGYARDFGALTLCPKARRIFEDVAPMDDVKVFVVPRPEKSYPLTLELVTGQEPHPDEQPEVTDLPWSPDHPWSVVYLDEGPPLPAAGHQSWQWRIEPTSFMRHHLTAPLEPDLLIADKLDRLMQRYEGELEGLPKLKTGEPIRRLQFPALEKLDVVTGLLDFAEISPAHLERLRALYAAGRRKPLGAEVTLDSLRERRGELRRVLSATN